MAWSRIAKTASVFVLLGLGLYGAFLAGQLYSNAGPWVQMHSNAGPWARTVGENPLVEMDEIPEHASQEMLKHFFPTGESPDGRFGTKCFKDYHGVEYCSVPLSRLAAFPERYQGRHIITTGFLRALGSTLLILFPSADGTMERSAFETLLIMPRAFPHELESRVKTGIWVKVSGEFDGTSGWQYLAIGELWHANMEEAGLDTEPPDVPLKPTLRKVSPPTVDMPNIQIAPDEP